MEGGHGREGTGKRLQEKHQTRQAVAGGENYKEPRKSRRYPGTKCQSVLQVYVPVSMSKVHTCSLDQNSVTVELGTCNSC